MINATPKNARAYAVLAILVTRPWSWPVRLLVCGALILALGFGMIMAGSPGVAK